MNPVTMTIISPQKECWPSQGLNQQPPVLRSATLPTEPWGLACGNRKKMLITSIFSFFPYPDDKLKVAKMMIFLFDRAENTVGKGENAGY